MKARFWFGETTKLNQNGTIFGWKVLYSKGKNSWKSFQQFGLNERKETNYFSKRSYWEVKEVKDGKEEIVKLDWENFLKEEERKLSEKQRKQIRELKEGIERNDRKSLSKAISLVESQLLEDRLASNILLTLLYSPQLFHPQPPASKRPYVIEQPPALERSSASEQLKSSKTLQSNSKLPETFRIGITGPPGAGN